jgi:hypothetical protein
MARFFSSSARALAKWLGFDRNKLPSHWKSAVEKFAAPGGAAEQVRRIKPRKFKKLTY